MMGGFGVCLCGKNARIHYCGMAENILVRSGDSRSSNADRQSTGHIQRDYLFRSVMVIWGRDWEALLKIV